ncbi:MAG TPA: MTH938/NDUFAF3 family protein [Gemmatimonadaceae bacterium]
MPDSRPSPRIVADGWGRLEIEDCPAPLRDAMLYPGGAREWDWRVHGTGHRAGIVPADVRELLDRGALEIVLARGRLGLLRVPPETLLPLAARGIRVHVLPTAAAIERYNALAAERPARRVGALIHSTC